jgi:tRNA A-37 threonylcarbamoyl transferase component Bud32
VSRPQSRDSVPPDLPGYRFIRHLGAGGNAQVYLYEQDLPHREVAVKVLSESALSETARRRFTAEANVTAGLAHRHIVQVFDAKVTDDGRPYIVMPYCPKPNLAVRARRAHFSVAEVLRIGIQIGSAVETSHRQHVLHRDIKPQNILTDSYSEPVLTDFGIATTKGGDGPEGLSVPWSPPEILYGSGSGDQRSDVYSLGATLWHVLAGRSPFEQPGGDNTAYALMSRIKSDPVPPTGRADVPDSLERLLRQAMAKEPAARPQTAMELIRRLQSIEQELRLPVTQPILPAGEQAEDTPPGNTVPPRAVRSGEATFGGGHGTRPRQAYWEQAVQPPSAGGMRDTTIAHGQPRGAWPAPAGPPAADSRDAVVGGRGGARPGPWAVPATPAPGAAPDEADDPTRARGPRRLDPWKAATAGTQEQQPRAGNRIPSGSWDWMTGGGSGGRVRQFPSEAPEAATLARPHAVVPGGGADAGPSGTTDEPGGWRAGLDASGRTHAAGAGAGDAGRQERRGPGRMLALAGGGVLLAVVVAVAVLGLGHGGSPTSALTAGSQPTQAGGAQDPLGLGPSAPTVTARGIGGQRVQFSWTYANSAPSDSFRVQVNGGSGQPVMPKKPDLVLSVAQGQRVCIQVQVISADGVNSPESNVACWPES